MITLTVTTGDALLLANTLVMLIETNWLAKDELAIMQQTLEALREEVHKYDEAILKNG